MLISSKLKVAIVDPYVKEPVPHCYNRLSDLLESKITIHHPSTHGSDSLRDAKADAVIVLGSASHVSQRLPWHQPLAETLDSYLQSKRPVLGLCFGHQLMADFYGGKVDYFKSPDDRLFGLREVKITKKLGSLEPGTPLTMAVTHRQIVHSLPPEMESIGEGNLDFLNFDLIRHRKLPFIGSQPHAEASMYFCERSAEIPEKDRPRAQDGGGRLIKAFFEEFF